MFRTKCLVCSSSKLVKVIDLGVQPFADSFIARENLSKADPAYPLECALCQTCGHVQTTCVTNPEHRYFQLHDYSYTSSNSGFAKAHWQEYAESAARNAKLASRSFVVEVGSNDGFLAHQFLMRGFRVLGVDASDYMAKLAAKRKVNTVVALFGRKSAVNIRKEHGRADLIVANNVFNHADLPLDFVKGVADLLQADGSFVFEQPSWLSSIKSEKFDQIYHEHVNYFTIRSLVKLLWRAGLYIVDAEVVDYHGGSLRVHAKKSRKPVTLLTETVKSMIKSEKKAGLFGTGTYRKLMDTLQQRRVIFLQKVYKIKEQGISIVAVGAPAKGNTFLNYYRLDKTVIDYVTDASPHKKGKYTPLTRIPIVSDEVFAKLEMPYALVLSWNLVDALKPKLMKINPRIRFISPEEPNV
jgi:2-polyprenyl-3-methyl-5-hydroxy-6-metoxy-1,4-benzoquinol methylase